jgi:hypothetical protein
MFERGCFNPSQNQTPASLNPEVEKPLLARCCNLQIKPEEIKDAK